MSMIPIYDIGDADTDIDDSDIAWESDVEHKFKNMDIANWQSKQWLDVTNRKY